MITCPSCNHQNPEGSLQCENCYTPLPATTSCPNCGASVQTDATFCGQCGFNLQAENSPVAASLEETALGSVPNETPASVPFPSEIPLAGVSGDILPETSMTLPIESPWDDNENINFDENDFDQDDPTIAQGSELPTGFPEVGTAETASFVTDSPETEFAVVEPDSVESATSTQNFDAVGSYSADKPAKPTLSEKAMELEASEARNSKASEANMAARAMAGATQLQLQKPALLHLQSNTIIEIPINLDVVHIGKPNDQIPPDLDVAGFPDSEVVSRVHADIRIEGDNYYLEDVGSSNGTYVNHSPMQKGNRHRLRAGDRIALGKGDLVTFIFKLSSDS